MTKYSTDTACTGNHKADNINSLVLSWADDIAEKLTERDCKLENKACYVHSMEGDTVVRSYTEEAQDIFSDHYDEQVDSLYELINESIKIHEPTEEEIAIKELRQYISEDDVATAYRVLLDASDKFGNKSADDYVLMWKPMTNKYTVDELLANL